MKFFRKNKLACLVFILLFFLPFCWHKAGEVDYGGDSTRLYFYDPASWLNNIALYFVSNLVPLGGPMPNFSLVPFLSLLIFVKKILLFGNGLQLNNIVNGILLSGGFASIFFIVEELFPSGDTKQRSNLPSVISGLFFVFSPILIFQWERALSAINQVFLYPLIFLLLLKYIKSGSYKYLILISLLVCIFALNFSFPALPWFFAYFFFSGIFLFFYSYYCGRLRVFLRGSVVLLFLFSLLNFYDLAPQAYFLMNPSRGVSIDRETVGNSVNYFLSIQPKVRFAYNLLNQDQYVISETYNYPLKTLIYNFGIKFLPLFFIYPLIVIFGLISKKKMPEFQKKIAALVLIVFLILMYFMTAGITNFGLVIYKMFFRLSLFSMFKSFYSKFAMVYVFYYSLTLGLSLKIIFGNILSNRKIKALSLFLIALILFNGWPLISGAISNTTLWNSNNVSSSSQIDPHYEEALNEIKKENESFRVLTLPLTNENYQLLKGKNGGVYFGPSSISFLAGKASFNGASAFSLFWPQVKHLIEKKDFENLNNLFGLLNIGYVFYDSDNYIYDNFFLNPYSVWLKRAFPTQEEVGYFARKIGVEKIYSFNNYNFLRRNSFLLPRIYIPEKIVCSNSGVDIISEILSFNDNIRLAVCLEEMNEKSNRNLFDYASDYFLEAKIKEIWPFEIYERALKNEVFYPYVKKKNRILWNLTILSEEYRKWLLRKSPRELSEKKIFFANKRINETISFLENETAEFSLYRKEIEGVFEVLERLNNNDKLGFLVRLATNLGDNLTKVRKSNFSNKDDWEVFIEKSIDKSKELIPKFLTSEIEYSVEVKKAGKYSVYLENAGVLDNLRLQMERKDVVRVASQENNHGLIKWGEVNLDKGPVDFLVKVNKSENLFDRNDWKIYVEKDRKDNNPGDVQKQFPVYYYKDIENYRSDIWYEIGGIPRIDKSMKLAVAEEDKFDEGKKNLKGIPEYLILREIDLSNDSWKKFYIRFDYGVKSVKVFLCGENFEDKDFFENKRYFDQIELRPVLEPKMILKLNNSSNDSFVEKNRPKIVFQKINPTKYLVRINNKDKKLVPLIFSASYHEGWKVYPLRVQSSKFKVQGDFTNVTASYFDGEIKERKAKDVFLDKNTFETWGLKSIANNKHFTANGYANLWFIDPEYFDSEGNCDLIIEYFPQRFFYIGIFVGILTFFGCTSYYFYSMKKKKK